VTNGQGKRVGFPYLTAFRARRLLDLSAYRLAPAAVAGLMASGHLSRAGDGLLVFAAIVLASVLLEREQLPLHLMPLAWFVVRAAVPVVGVGIALAVLAIAGAGQAASAMVIPIFGAWIVTAFAAWSTRHFESVRQVRLAVIGSEEVALGLDEELHGAGLRAYQVIGWVSDNPRSVNHSDSGPRWLGSLDDGVRGIVSGNKLDLLVHSASPGADSEDQRHGRLEIFEQVAEECLDMPVRLIEASLLYEDLLGHVPLGQSTSAWFQYLLHPRYRAGSPFPKRVFDLVVGSLMLLAAAPVLAVCAIVIKLTDRGPIFYRQARAGEGGTDFSMVKMRSMTVAAEGEGAQWSAADDVRITGIGRLMRRTHFDEMPQLWSVLRGEMTLIGPRPERPELIAELERQLPYYDRRHLVKPGIAGWAQARCGYGGSEEGTSWKLCHDLFYLKHRSVYFDLLILIENVRVALRSDVQYDVRAPQEQFILAQPAPSEQEPVSV
jgi:lipopolysaccharide/colanic/teichoic acid biosynthesis glycosyltransferase